MHNQFIREAHYIDTTYERGTTQRATLHKRGIREAKLIETRGTTYKRGKTYERGITHKRATIHKRGTINL